MSEVLAGVRVIELATWGFVPSAGVAMADWGADVIKVEHPVHGDPMRGLVTSGLMPAGSSGSQVNFMFETFSRGKRSVGIDLTNERGREVLLKLVETADVFLTNYLPKVRTKLGIDVEDLRARNPKIIYARGSGAGPAGPDADTGGYDMASYWARSGLAHATTPPGSEWPISMPAPAFGDLQGGGYLAGGVAGALFKRERTGEPSVVDVSLLGAGAWAASAHIAAAGLYGIPNVPPIDHDRPANPIVNSYRTSDGRFISLVMLEADRYWAPLCEVLGRAELATDDRFADAKSRASNNTECVRELEAIFAAEPLEHWRTQLAKQRGVWAVVGTPREIIDDAQCAANGYVARVPVGEGLPVVTAPVQFDQHTSPATPAPELGDATELLLMELGLSWDEIVELKSVNAIN